MEIAESVEKLRQKLLKQANQEIAYQQKKYMREQFDYVGIKTPQRNAIARPFLKQWKKLKHDELLSLIELLWIQPERDFRYIGAELLYRHATTTLNARDVEFLGRLITNQPWWDITDNLDRTVGIIATKQQMLDWAQQNNFWLRRVAIIHQLKRKSDTDTDLLAQIITLNLGSKEFFINKAIGWALREYSKTNPQWVSAFITEHRDQMATLTVREASKYL